MDNTLNTLFYQLNVIRKLINDDKKNGFYKYNYLIKSSECVFIDTDALRNFITTVDVKNFALFEELILICNEIIDFWNKETVNLIEKKLENPINVTRDNGKGFFHSVNDIYVIHFLNKKHNENYNSIESKIDFIKNNDYTSTNINLIASKCNAIISWITGAYPETKDFVNSKKGFVYFGRSGIIKKILKEINSANFTLADAVDYIEKNSSVKAYDLIIKELNKCYEYIRNEFMFKINDDDIKNALETYSNNLEYIYVNEYELSKISHFVKVINKKETVFNVDGFSNIEKENSTKLIYLNNLMIDYYNGFFVNEIEGFENISILRDLINFYSKGNNDETLQSISDNMLKDNLLSNDFEPLNQKDNNIKDLHNHIFKANAFEVWQSMYNDFKIKESSRTDIKFMFEIMKYEKLIHPTVTQTALLNWINETYQLTISKARYIDFKNDTKRLAIFNKAKSMN